MRIRVVTVAPYIGSTLDVCMDPSTIPLQTNPKPRPVPKDLSATEAQQHAGPHIRKYGSRGGSGVKDKVAQSEEGEITSVPAQAT